MSRSFGATLLTTRSPMSSRPSLMSSRPGNASQCGGLAAARWTDEDEELAVLDLQVEVVDGDDVFAIPLVHVVERDGRHRVTRSMSQRQAAGGLVAHARERIIVRVRNPHLPDSMPPMHLLSALRRVGGRLTELVLLWLSSAACAMRCVAADGRRQSAVAERSATCCRRCWTDTPASPPRRGGRSGCEASRSIGSSGPCATHRRTPPTSCRCRSCGGRTGVADGSASRAPWIGSRPCRRSTSCRSGDDYYVVDGHNRVAAARQAGGLEIDADVTQLLIPGVTQPGQATVRRRLVDRYR